MNTLHANICDHRTLSNDRFSTRRPLTSRYKTVPVVGSVWRDDARPLVAGELGKAPAAGQGELAGATVAAAAAVEEDEDEEDVSEIQARLEALRS